jgi:hypothetical protein
VECTLIKKDAVMARDKNNWEEPSCKTTDAKADETMIVSRIPTEERKWWVLWDECNGILFQKIVKAYELENWNNEMYQLSRKVWAKGILQNTN